MPVCTAGLTHSLLLFCFSGSAAADVLIFTLLADDVIKLAVDIVAVVVVVTVDVVKEIAVLVTAGELGLLHTCIGAHLALFGCRDIDGSEGEQERALSPATFKNSVRLGVIDRALSELALFSVALKEKYALFLCTESRLSSCSR